jgi:hypothetical protein
MHGADRIRRHLISRSSGHRVPDMCDYPRSSAPGLLLLPRSSSLPTMPHLPPTHHETSERDSPTNKIKVKQTKCPRFEFKSHQVNDSSQSNQEIDHLVSQSPPWWVHWQQKYKVWSLNLRPHEAQLEDQKVEKSLRMSSTRKKSYKTNKRQTKQKSKDNLKIK